MADVRELDANGNYTAPNGQSADSSDIVRGDNRDNVINGQNGNDVLSGGVGDDTLLGGRGEDMLAGGRGNDILTGGDDDDDDTFKIDLRDLRMSDTENHDTITDFNANEDTLRFDLFRGAFNQEGGGKVAVSANAFQKYEFVSSETEFKILINLLTAHEDMRVLVNDNTGTNDWLIFDFGNGHETTLRGNDVRNFIQNDIFGAGLMSDEGNRIKELENFYRDGEGNILDYDRGMIGAVIARVDDPMM